METTEEKNIAAMASFWLYRGAIPSARRLLMPSDGCGENKS
jgi:hypothetical protein